MPVQSVLAVAGRVRMRSGYLHMIELLRGLSARGCKVALLCSGLQAEFRSREIPFSVHTWGEIAGRWPALRGEGALRGFVLREKVQILHVHGGPIGLAGNRFLRSVSTPAVFTPHSAPGDHRTIRRIQQRAAKVIALTEYLREGLVNRSRVPRGKLSVILPGVEVEAFDLLLPQTGGRVPVVGTVSPLEPGRGQGDFLHAAKLVLDSGREAEFVVGGDGSTERALRHQAADLDLQKRLTFATRLADYRDVIATLDIFVRPTVHGGIGHTVLEAMAMGKPAVTIAAGNMLEIVQEGRTGFMVPRGDVRSMAAVIQRLIDDPSLAREMGLSARRRVAEKFSMERLTKDTLRIYSEAIACAQR